MTRPVPVEALASFAHRAEGGVRVVLHLPDRALPGDSVILRLRSGERSRRQQATVTRVDGGTTLDVVVPAKGLGRRVWRIAVRTDEEAPFQPIQARLLASDRQPVSLLTGPMPRTRLPEPAPRTRPSAASDPGWRGRGRQVVRGLRRRIIAVRRPATSNRTR